MICISLNYSGERPAQPIPPPPETEWYHGRLDRCSAEQRLKSAYKLGTYLGMFHVNIDIIFILIMIFSLFSLPPPLVFLESFIHSLNYLFIIHICV